MKKDKLFEKLKHHTDNKKYVKIIQQIPGGEEDSISGYILQYSDDFVLIHETHDFNVLGYVILPIGQIKRLKVSSADKYFGKIMNWEKITDKIGIDFIVELKSLQSVFRQLQKKNIIVIVECEQPDIDSFTIGPIVKVGSKNIYLQYFDTEGYFDKESTSVDYNSITKVQFNDNYSVTYSKYTRYRKENLI